MRRVITVALILAVVFVAADQWARAQVKTLIAETVADRLAAGSADVQLRGFVVLPQLVTGELRQVDLDIDDAVVGDPAVRLARMDATLLGLRVPFPPPDTLDDVIVSGGDVEVLILPRELERLLAVQRPGWDVSISGDGVRATGEVEAVAVSVLADVAVVGQELRFSATEVDAGDLGIGAASQVAAAFDTRLDLPSLPGGVVIETAEPSAAGLRLSGTVSGSLALG